MAAQRYHYLDSLRGIAAMIVLLYHASFTFAHSSPVMSLPFIDRGYLMVDLFFVLSGFVIAHSYWHRLKDWASVVRFQMYRAARLLPLHILTLFVFLAIELWLYLGDFNLITAPFAQNSMQAFAANITLTQPFLMDELTYNEPAWSIAVEFYTYIIFAVLCLVSLGHRGVIDVATVLIILGSTIWLAAQESFDLTQTGGMVRCLLGFFLGVLVFRISKVIHVPSAFATISVLVAVLAFCQPELLPLPDIAFPYLFAFVMLVLVASDGSALKTLLHARPLRKLGDWSYGIYLWHTAVFWVIPVLMGMIGFDLWMEPYNHDPFITTTPLVHTVMLIVGIVVTCALAAFTYRAVEMPCNRWMRDRASTAHTRSNQIQTV